MGVKGDPVAITGIGGRYPESKNVDEFWSNLLSGRELCVEDDSRWPVGYMRLPAKAGKIPGIEKFDASFFGMNDREANEMDPQFKICHETTFEAIIDAGLDPVSLRGDRTGMFIGYCYSDAWSAQLQVDATLYNSQWTEQFSEVSKSFGFKGPCLTYDSACASSFSAFNEAVKLLEANVIDTAIVAGVSVSTSPVTAQGFRSLGMTSLEGQSRCMDKRANGYVRSETIASILLQRKSASKRIYAVVVNTMTNSDGYKKEGITFPGQESMERLMESAYKEAGLDPKETKYIEAHVTGTQAGDPVECKAIEAVFCPNDRDGPVLLGCLKSNMGHPEGASGVAAITKACQIMQKKLIPPNINYEAPNPNIPGLLNGKLKPVLQVTPFPGGVISLNSFGFGGTNIHTIIRPFEEGAKNEDAITGVGGINRLILFKARTAEAFQALKEKIERHPKEITNEYLALVDNISRLSPSFDLPYRGYFILDTKKRLISSDWIKTGANDEECSVYVTSDFNETPSWGKNLINLLSDVNVKVKEITDASNENGAEKCIRIKIEYAEKRDPERREGSEKSGENEGKIKRISSCNDMLSLIGELYMRSCENRIKLDRLYPAVRFPVSSNTASISPLISWNHDTDWTVYKVPDYFRFIQKNKRLYFDYSTTHAYLCGHIIDGRIIFPAAQYLWAIWQSLAMELCDNSQMAFLSTGIKFWNVKLSRAIIVDRGDEVALVTRVNPFTGFFEIIQDDACLVSGHALLTYDDGVPSLGENEEEDVRDDLLISKRDFYKELRVRGYDYEDEFQGVESCNADGTGGTVSFLKNWVCFCDAVFQLSLINDTMRQLLLPTGFEYLQIDAKVFKDISKSEFELYEKLLQGSASSDACAESPESECAENNASDAGEGTQDVGQAKESKEEEMLSKGDADKEAPKFKVTIRKETQEVFTNGLYIRGMRESPAPRKKAAPTVLKFNFHPFNESGYEDAELRIAKADYADSCLALINRKMAPEEKLDCNNNLTESDPNLGIDSSKEDGAQTKCVEGDGATSVEAKQESAEEEPKEALLVTLKKLTKEGKRITPEEMMKHSPQLSKDLLLSVPIDQETLKHQLDIVASSFHGQALRVTEVNLSSKVNLQSQVEETLVQFCPGTSYNLISDEEAQKSPDQKSNDKSADQKSNEKSPDQKSNDKSVDQKSAVEAYLNQKSVESELLLIQHPSLGFTFCENHETAHKRNEKYLKVLNSAHDQMISGNFLMVILRTDLTPVEEALSSDANQNHASNDLSMVDAILASLKSNGLAVISTKKIGSIVSILARKPQGGVCEMGGAPQEGGVMKPRPKMVEVETFKYDWVDKLRDQIFIEDGEGENLTRRPNGNAPVWLIAHDCDTSGLSGFLNCVRNEDKRFRGIVIQDKVSAEEEESIIDDCVKYDLTCAMYKDGKLGSLLASKRSEEEVLPPIESEKVEMASHGSDSDQDSGFHDNDHIAYTLDVETKGDLTSLKYHEVSLPDSEGIVDVHFSALNFKDVMVASGRVPPSAYPATLRPMNSGEMGMEFSGIDTRGNRVMGLTPTDAISTKIDVGSLSDFLFKVPDWMTLEDAATVPVVYATVYYALIMRGKLYPGESILIHAGSGGVGQAAINVCLSMGCKVFTTVGTKEKRKFIKETFPSIDDDHIFDSRSVSFGDDLLIATNGRGVDVILNSLSEEKLQVGLTCLADSGRFIEIGKYDLITNSSFDASLLSHNQTFQAVCLAFFMAKVASYKGIGPNPEVMKLRSLMENGIKSGVVKPLSRHVFNWNQAEEAFRFMASGKHVGKILMRMREGDRRSDESVRGIRKRVSFDPKKSYIVIGGLGGMGLEVSYWLIKKGVRNLIITSRTGLRTPYQRFCLDRIKHFGATVVVRTEDVAVFDQAQTLIHYASSLGPVGGVFNLAMVLKDALFENQSSELFEQACAVKVAGTHNLDIITRRACPELNHFVCFSSLVSTIGNAGQSNYGFANSFMDNLCARRKADGLPGLAIGWGAIGDVGHVAECMGNDVIIAGSVPQRINSCFEVLELVLFGSDAVVGSFIPADRSSFESKGDLLASILNVLGIKDHSKVDPKATLGDLGLDSLMAVEIKQILEKKYEKVMSTKEIRELTVAQIKEMSTTSQS